MTLSRFLREAIRPDLIKLEKFENKDGILFKICLGIKAIK